MRTELVPKVCATGIAAIIAIVPLSAKASFPDVAEQHPYFDAINYAQEHDIVQGYPDGTFKPENKVSRAEFATILIRGFSEKRCQLANDTFTDVEAEADPWFEPYICAAKDLSIIQGYPDHTLRPHSPITFAEAAAMIDRGFNLEGPGGDEIIWYKPGVASLENRNAIPTSIKQLDQQLNRAELIEIIYRILHTRSTRMESIILSMPLEKASYLMQFDNGYPRAFDAPSVPYDSIMPVHEHIALEHPQRSHNFVIIHSTFEDLLQANKAARQLYGGWVLPTNLTEKLTPDLYAVVEGPFASREDTEKFISFWQARINPGSYIKDAGSFLWPEDYSLEQEDFPPGFLQAVAGFMGEDAVTSLKEKNITWLPDMIEWWCDPQGPAYKITISTDKKFTMVRYADENVSDFEKDHGVEKVPPYPSDTLTLYVRDDGTINYSGHWMCFD